MPDIPATKHVFRAKCGVYEIFLDEEHLNDNKPCNYTYPDLNTFVSDMNTMCNMIADGPL